MDIIICKDEQEVGKAAAALIAPFAIVTFEHLPRAHSHV